MVTTALHTLPVPVENLLDCVELLRSKAARQLSDERCAARGRYFTLAAIAQLMTAMFTWDAPYLWLPAEVSAQIRVASEHINGPIGDTPLN